MDVQEFSKLKVDDIVRNEMFGSNGTVVDVESMGVRIRWLIPGAVNDGPTTHQIGPTWFYSVQGTAWFHWSKVEGESTDAQ